MTYKFCVICSYIDAILGFVIVAGIIPANAKHTQPYLKLIADQFDSMIDGLPVYDAYEGRQVNHNTHHMHHLICIYVIVCQRLCNSRLLVAINDLRAMSHVSMSTQAPAINWACRDCNVLGVKVALLDAVVYVGAIRLLAGTGSPRTRALTREWRQRFAGTPDLLAMADRPIFKRDAKFNYEAGVTADQARHISGAALDRARIAGGFLGLCKYIICDG